MDKFKSFVDGVYIWGRLVLIIVLGGILFYVLYKTKALSFLSNLLGNLRNETEGKRDAKIIKDVVNKGKVNGEYKAYNLALKTIDDIDALIKRIEND